MSNPSSAVAVLRISRALREQIASEAAHVYPRECCGLIEGVRSGDGIEVNALHPAPNLSSKADRFEIDPAEHFRLMRELRGTGREIVGCYHSHPDGNAKPSARDCAGADEAGFVWMIAATSGVGASQLAAFLFNGKSFCALEMT